MRIFYAADHEPFPGNNLWHTNLYLPLVDLGHEVIPFDYNLTPHFHNVDPSAPEQRAFISRNQPQLEQELLRQITAAHRTKPIDVFFSYFYSAFCRPKVIRAIRDMGICTVNWYCNASFQFHLVEAIAPAYDYCLVPEKFRLSDYQRIGANPIYCQEAANPNFYRPQPVPQEFDLTFVGQKYGDRPDYVRHLLDSGLDVRVWGMGWQPSAPQSGTRTRADALRRLRKLTTRSGWNAGAHRIAGWLKRGHSEVAVQIPPEICGPALDDSAAVSLYSRSKISLGFSSCGDTHRSGQRILQVRLRDFEAPMSGAFYMVEYMDELEEFYDIGHEIVCYRDKYDLAEKAKYYLEHESDRERIREAGHRRAVADHSWQQRLRNVFREIGLSE